MTSDPIIVASDVGTVVFVVATALAVADPDDLAWLSVVVSLVLFVLGSLAFVRTIVLAAGRSRREELSVPGLWLLSDSAPTPVRHRLLGATAIQVVVALVGASVRPFTPLAFGVLAPLYGIGLCGLWAAVRGTFPARRG